MEFFCQVCLSGLATGFLYGGVAIGFVVIYKSSGVLNFAQGELLLIGAYIFYTFNSMFHFPAVLAFFITVAFCFLFGMVIERSLIRHMFGEPSVSIVMITIGLSICLKSIVPIIWTSQYLALPSFFSKVPFQFSGIYLPQAYGYMGFVALIAMVAVVIFINFSRLGLGMRATADDPFAASLMGVDANVVSRLSWAISAALASVSGIFLGYINQIAPDMSHVALALFPAVVVGGLDSLLGAFIGGILIALLEAFTGAYLGSEIKSVVPFIALLLILMIKPYGLFGKEEIERV